MLPHRVLLSRKQLVAWWDHCIDLNRSGRSGHTSNGHIPCSVLNFLEQTCIGETEKILGIIWMNKTIYFILFICFQSCHKYIKWSRLFCRPTLFLLTKVDGLSPLYNTHVCIRVLYFQEDVHLYKIKRPTNQGRV